MDKKSYEAFKDIKNRIATGKTTTFVERNIVNIILKKQKKKKKSNLLMSKFV